MQDGNRFLQVQVRRGGETDFRFEEYRVPAMQSQTVLDVVTWIQRNLEPALSYRFACRVGMCGSCAMTVNGRPRWTCRSHVADVIDGDRLVIEPLRNLPVIKDLACDLSSFFDKWQKAGGVFEPTQTRAEPMTDISPLDPARREANAGIECINCGICYAACDVVSADADYLGPAALNRAWTLINDARDGARGARLRAVTGPGGCQGCHSQQGCVSHCPKTLNPTRSIAGLKKAAARAALRGEL